MCDSGSIISHLNENLHLWFNGTRKFDWRLKSFFIPTCHLFYHSLSEIVTTPYISPLSKTTYENNCSDCVRKPTEE